LFKDKAEESFGSKWSQKAKSYIKDVCNSTAADRFFENDRILGMIASAVVGSNYGDCGKGVIVDYLVNRKNKLNTVVVRYNGGAQAGHTVQTPDGKSHTFRHFSSGTFQGARTFLSRHFVLNPMLYVKERIALDALKVSLNCLIVDPRATITTPWDIIANQARERAAGDHRIGSCGVGHRDTVDRNEYSEDRFCFTIAEAHRDLTYKRGYMESKLEWIRGEWLPERLEKCGVKYTDELKDLALSDAIMENYLGDLSKLCFDVTQMETRDLCESLDSTIIFEGSQGLGLDQTQGTIPHVTRSSTGIKNIIEIAEEAGIEAIEVYYTTRAYLTRHGAGPMESELEKKPFSGIVEKTNLSNEFQGKFRFGYLDVQALRDRIKRDLQNASTTKVKIFPKLAVTCVDQIDVLGRFKIGGTIIVVRRDGIADAIAREVGVPSLLESRGPTRETISERFVL
jgi:adenylosuccinate synthase